MAVWTHEMIYIVQLMSIERRG